MPSIGLARSWEILGLRVVRCCRLSALRGVRPAVMSGSERCTFDNASAGAILSKLSLVAAISRTRRRNMNATIATIDTVANVIVAAMRAAQSEPRH